MSSVNVQYFYTTKKDKIILTKSEIKSVHKLHFYFLIHFRNFSDLKVMHIKSAEALTILSGKFAKYRYKIAEIIPTFTISYLHLANFQRRYLTLAN